MPTLIPKLRSFDAASGATTSITETVPLDCVLQNADVGIVGASKGPVYVVLSYGDIILNSFTELASGWLRTDAVGNLAPRIAWQGALATGDHQVATPALTVSVRNDTGSTVTAIALSYTLVSA